MTNDDDLLAGLPDDQRIRSRRIAGGVATLIVDATGLGAPAREQMEAALRRELQRRGATTPTPSRRIYDTRE